MDRDQVNCIHYLYQGDPAQRLNEKQLFGGPGRPPLVWCGVDTVAPLVNNGILQDKRGAVTMPTWCLTVENQLRTVPQPDFVFGYPFSTPIRKPGEPRPAFLAISYAGRSRRPRPRCFRLLRRRASAAR